MTIRSIFNEPIAANLSSLCKKLESILDVIIMHKRSVVGVLHLVGKLGKLVLFFWCESSLKMFEIIASDDLPGQSFSEAFCLFFTRCIDLHLE